jgi:hypothetical protein
LAALAATVLAALVLAGCTSGGDAMVQTLGHVAQFGEGEEPRLNPDFRYLRVVAHGQVSYLALGNVIPTPEGPVEVWYSSAREVLAFQSGRLVQATGLPIEWRNVRLPELPPWTALAHGEPLHWVRSRDVMPGYRYGATDSLQLRPIQPPASSALRDVDAGQLAWFEETSQIEMAQSSTRAEQALRLPAARYAVDLRDGRGVVVYGEQCLSQDLCFSWQRWSAQGASR